MNTKEATDSIDKSVRLVYSMGIEFGKLEMALEILKAMEKGVDLAAYLNQRAREIALQELNRDQIPVEELLS